MRNSWKQLVLTGALVSGFAVGGCSTMHKDTKIDQTRVAGVPDAQKPEVVQAQQQLAQFKQDETAAKAAITEAENRAKLAESELGVSKSQLTQAESAQKLVKGNETEKTKVLDLARKNVDAQQAKVDYLNTLTDIAKSQKDLAEKNVDLAQAKINQANYTVLKRTDPKQVEAMKVTGAQFDSQVAQKQADVSKVEAKLSQQRIEARDQYNKWSNLEKQVESNAAPELRRAAIPPPPKG